MGASPSKTASKGGGKSGKGSPGSAAMLSDIGIVKKKGSST
jgi:hypothetical protein